MYIVLDCETGGIGLDKSLLTFYFQITDNKFNSIAELDLAMKPDDGIYRITGEAMGINKINLIEHDKIAIPYKQAGTLLYNFLKDNFKGSDDRYVPVGHGMSGDLDQIFDKLMKRATWETFCSYRRLDTSVACQFLRSCNLLPDTVSGSLESLKNYFKLPNGELHNAKYDTITTLEVLKRLIKLVNDLRPIKNVDNEGFWGVELFS